MLLANRQNRPRDGLPGSMHPVELAQLIAIVETLAPGRCLEWGSGDLTQLLLERSPFIERYVAVEHDPAFFAEVRAVLVDPRLSLNLVVPDVAPPAPEAPQTRQTQDAALSAEFDERSELDPLVMRSYIEFPRSLAQRFDFVLVHGLARCFCMRAGFELLAPGGVLVVCDAQHARYRSAAAALGRAVFLEPWQRGQLALIKKA